MTQPNPQQPLPEGGATEPPTSPTLAIDEHHEVTQVLSPHAGGVPRWWSRFGLEGHPGFDAYEATLFTRPEQLDYEIEEMLYLCEYRLEEQPSVTAPTKRKLCLMSGPTRFNNEVARFYVGAYEPDISRLEVHAFLERRLDLSGKSARAEMLAQMTGHTWELVRSGLGDTERKWSLASIIKDKAGNEMGGKGAGSRPQAAQNAYDLVQDWLDSGEKEWVGPNTWDPFSAHCRGRRTRPHL